MSLVYKCDRCGKVYRPANDQTMIIDLRLVNVFNNFRKLENSFDLCEDCVLSFKDWVEDGMVENE